MQKSRCGNLSKIIAVGGRIADQEAFHPAGAGLRSDDEDTFASQSSRIERALHEGELLRMPRFVGQPPCRRFRSFRPRRVGSIRGRPTFRADTRRTRPAASRSNNSDWRRTHSKALPRQGLLGQGDHRFFAPLGDLEAAAAEQRQVFTRNVVEQQRRLGEPPRTGADARPAIAACAHRRPAVRRRRAASGRGEARRPRPAGAAQEDQNNSARARWPGRHRPERP